ncbi:MAG: response regulator [Chloroflexi bacterium]|nr:response regulator [Chloroflexota bacterium]MBP8059477.1 response regulator [Chloroflexota bacterium]
MASRILVVDDDIMTVRLLSQILQRQGYEVHVAYNGEEALLLARSLNPQLIILDIMMPGLDGYQVCQRLKASPDTADIVVLMLTAKGQVNEQTQGGKLVTLRMTEQMRGFAVGAADFVTKPVQAGFLLKRVETLLWSGGA